VPAAASETAPRCDVCGEPTKPSTSPWTFRCANCGLWQSELEPAIDAKEGTLAEEDRVAALVHIRHSNFARIFHRLSQLMTLEHRSLLDVGCAYGWFLSAAAEHRMTGLGIEPDAYTAAAAQARGLDVVTGYFPESAPAGKTFDVVVFNDVLEHIPDVRRMLAACRQVLARGGFLVLSVPTSSGTLFRLARLLAATGFAGPWERLWQKSFPSPHRYYFNQEVLDLVCRRHGLSRVAAESTMTIHPRGLWARMRFDRRRSMLANVVLYAGVLLLYPAYVLFAHADTELLIYRNDRDVSGA